MTKQVRDWKDKLTNISKRCEIAESYGETIALWPEDVLKIIGDYTAAEAREKKLREAIEAAIADIDHEAFRTACNGLEDALASLYPEEETKTFTFDAIIHIYDGIRTAVQNKRLTVEAKSAEEAEHKLSKKIHDDFKMRTHLGLSSLLLTRVEEEEAK